MIVLALIALVVIVIVFAYFTGTFGKIFKQTATLQETVQADVTSAQTKCAQYCIAAQNADDWKTSDFCTKQFEIDENIDGEIDETEKEYNCYDSPISQSCTVTINDIEYSGADC